MRSIYRTYNSDNSLIIVVKKLDIYTVILEKDLIQVFKGNRCFSYKSKKNINEIKYISVEYLCLCCDFVISEMVIAELNKKIIKTESELYVSKYKIYDGFSFSNIRYGSLVPDKYYFIKENKNLDKIRKIKVVRHDSGYTTLIVNDESKNNALCTINSDDIVYIVYDVEDVILNDSHPISNNISSMEEDYCWTPWMEEVQ